MIIQVTDTLQPLFRYDQVAPEHLRSRCGYIELRRLMDGDWLWKLHEGDFDPFGFDNSIGSEPTLEAARQRAEAAAGDPIGAVVAEAAAGPHDIAAGQDATGKRGADLALRGRSRPTMRWQGRPERLRDSQEQLAREAGPDAAAAWSARFARGEDRRMPVMYSTDAAAETVRECSGPRLLECQMHYLCTCCGESVIATEDATGWLIQDSPHDDFASPGSPLCTSCAHMAVRMCPHFAKIELLGGLIIWRIDGEDGFRPARDAFQRSAGGIEPDEASGLAIRSSLDELRSAHAALLRLRR